MRRHRRWSLALTATGPAAVVFALLVLAHALSPAAAVLGFLGLTLLSFLLLRWIRQDLDAVTRFVATLDGPEEAAVPELRTDFITDLLIALKLTQRDWHLQSAALQPRLRFHESLFDSLPGPIVLFDRQRRIISENEAARALFGNQMRGRDLAAILRNPDVLQAVDHVLIGHAGREIALSMPDNRAFRAMIEPLRQAAGTDAAVVLSLHDITTLKRVEQMRGDFVANASHELRTPLAAVLGFIETLQGPAKDDGEARERFLAIMHEQATRMSRLIADLLNLSHIELNEQCRPDGRADLNALLRRVASGLEGQAGERQMSIALDLDESLPPALGDEDELTQIFQNLLDNALRYGRDGTAVKVVSCLAPHLPAAMTDRRHAAAMVTVIDQSDGIARDHIPRLTERFFRVDAARSRRLGGTGLGLAIVKHVINRHRGALRIESDLGVGSSFTVYLPLESDEERR